MIENLQIDIIPDLNAIVIRDNMIVGLDILQISIDKIHRIYISESGGECRLKINGCKSVYRFKSMKDADLFRIEINDAILRVIDIRNKKSMKTVGDVK
jgi:hypothetical protein